MQFKRAQELFELKSRDTGLEAEIQGGRAALRNLGSKHHKLDEEALKQQEILYTQACTMSCIIIIQCTCTCSTNVCTHNSSLEGATELKFAPFCSS